MANEMNNTEVMEYVGLPAETLETLRTAEGETYRAASNAFIDALMNKITYMKIESMKFENGFKKYDGYPVIYGDTIENVFVDLPKGYTFDPNATDPFTKKINNVKTLYATINFERQYCSTIQDKVLRKAVLNEYGLMGIVDDIINNLVKAMTIDEYFAQIALLNNANIYAHGFEEVVKGSTPKETAYNITDKIVDVVGSFAMPLKTNNKLGVMQTTSRDKCLLIIKRKLLKSINLDYLTGVFNLSKVDLLKNIIEVETFQVEDDEGNIVGDDIDFVVLDTDGFDNHVALQDNGMIYNPKGKYTNHFTNLWKIFGFKYYYNARAFKLVDAQTTSEQSQG
jgi:hypothetical protein